MVYRSLSAYMELIMPNEYELPSYRELAKEVRSLKLEIAELMKIAIASSDSVMSLSKASDYLGVSMNRMYKLNSEKAIPYSKPGGKTAFYRKSDLDRWASKNRVSSQEELQRGRDAA